ncbi:nucleoside hydrolase [Aeromonas bivalvium]|uniref:nucleoside hydrolase n=1 Tax=Aeromonas bivalvium TaxID=440079 RepID=UPI000DD0D476|nr:nucleoside hydrolase [Aeromonas bivalvium]
MTSKIILDTDPGIDDAMAILFAEAHPDIDLVGITTVFGNATIENGTRNALWLKQKYGMRTDVAMGAAAPLVREPVGPTTVVHGPSGLGDVAAGEVTLAPDPRPAWQYLVETVQANPGEITLVTIGPLTNLALALAHAPEIVTQVKQVVVMGGAFGVNGHRGNVTPYAEANIHDDPEAANRVFTAPWPLVIIGLDVTQQSFFSGAYLDALRDEAGEPGRFLWDVSRFYLRFYSERIGLDGCHVHDPSAIAYVIEPTLFTLREGPVRVVTDGPAIGHTLQKFDGRRHPHDGWVGCPAQRVGVAVRDQALLALYRDTLVAWGTGRD